jgi:DNA-binding YbaB/EbfC family protein
MAQMFEAAAQLQQRMLDAQEELARTHVEGSAGGGMVTATVTGAGELVGLRIAPEAVDGTDPDTAETLADLVLAAVRDATGRAGELQRQAMGPLAQGLGGPGGLGVPGLPGM